MDTSESWTQACMTATPQHPYQQPSRPLAPPPTIIHDSGYYSSYSSECSLPMNVPRITTNGTTMLTNEGMSPSPSSLSSPDDSHSSSSLNFLQDDFLFDAPPLGSFDEAECMAMFDDYDRQHPVVYDMHGVSSGDHSRMQASESDYVTDIPSPSNKYYIMDQGSAMQEDIKHNYRPVATSLSFNRTAFKPVYSVRSNASSEQELRSDSLTPSDDDDSTKLPIPTYSRTRSKMHDLAVKNRLITDQNPRGHGLVSLSAEEKRTLLQEGYRLPTKLPLTREEEEALKLVRRKIKNKLSAQESRRKRKEYMDTLEQKVHVYYTENVSLKQRIKQLEASNSSMSKRLHDLETGMVS